MTLHHLVDVTEVKQRRQCRKSKLRSNVAIATSWLVTSPSITSSTVIYTANTTSGAYERDLVITNGGANLGYVTVGASASSAAAATGFALPAGGTVILTQCAIPANAKIYGYSASGTIFSVGLGSNVSYI